MNRVKNLNSIDLFSGMGGLTVGLKDASYDVIAAIENNKSAAATYRLNHSLTQVIEKDIKEISVSEIQTILGDKKLHLLAGCPPCQGFSTVRKLNGKRSARDDRNSLILEYFRFVEGLRPMTIMMENVPGLKDYYLFKKMVVDLRKIGYNLSYGVLNVKDYEVPQSRKRLVLLGSRLGHISLPKPINRKLTVRDTIESLNEIIGDTDPIHNIRAKHTKRIQSLIKLIPKDGGSRRDLPQNYILECHKKENVGFNDIYGRLKWDKWSSTITGGCLNPSKGRFLHPSEDRCISAREAALLQTYPIDYRFSSTATKTSIALMIGNSLPPQFGYHQAKLLHKHVLDALSAY